MRTLHCRTTVAALLASMLLLVGSGASAYFTVKGSGTGTAATGTLAQPALSVGTLTPTSAALSWTQPFAPTGYALAQSPGSLAGCPAAPALTATGCTATSLTPNTAYTWSLTAKSYSWTSIATAAATTPKQATTTTLSGLTPTTGYGGASFSATATVAGTSGFGTPAGSVVFSLFTTADCSGAAAYTSAAQTLLAGKATGTLQPDPGTYYWRAAYTPSDTVNLASTSACSATPITVDVGMTYAATGTPTTRSSSGAAAVAYPAGTAQGDLLLLVMVNNSNVATATPTGWTQIAAPATTGIAMTVWWRRAGTATSVSPTFNTSTGATAWVVDFKNVGNPVQSGTVAAGTGPTLLGGFTPGAVTPGVGGTRVLSLVATNSASTLSLTTARSFSLERTESASNGLNARSFGVADRTATTTAQVDAPTWTAGLQALNPWAWITVAFRP